VIARKLNLRMSLRILSYLLVLPLFVAGGTSKDMHVEDYDHVIVIPHIHGDLASTIDSLYIAYRWVEPNSPQISVSDFISHITGTEGFAPLTTSKRVALVQLGNISHRDGYSYPIYNLFAKLPHTMNWNIVNLAGDHEIFSHVRDDDKYLHPQEHEGYNRKKERPSAFRASASVRNIIRKRFGLVARIASNTYDSSSEDTDPSILFLHAGISMSWFHPWFPIYAQDKSVQVDKLNALFRSTLNNEKVLAGLLMDPNAPFWTRNFSDLHDGQLCGYLLPRIQKLFKVSRFVVGHSADHENRSVRMRCNGRIILADFAMSKGVEESYPGVLIFSYSNSSDGTRELSGILEAHEDGYKNLMSPGELPHIVAVRNQIPDVQGGGEIKVEPTQILTSRSNIAAELAKESPKGQTISTSPASVGQNQALRIMKRIQKATRLETIHEEPLEESLEEPSVEADSHSTKPVKKTVGRDLKDIVLLSTTNPKQTYPPVQSKTEEYIILRKPGHQGVSGRGLPNMKPMEITSKD
jgi:hypothetical protein